MLAIARLAAISGVALSEKNKIAPPTRTATAKTGKPIIRSLFGFLRFGVEEEA